MLITAKNVEKGTEINAEKYFGEDLPEGQEQLDKLVAIFGAGTVYSNAVDSMVITSQGLMRRADKAGKTATEIQALIDAQNYQGGSRVRKDPVEAFLGKFETLSPEKQEEMLAALRAKIAALQG